MAAYSALTAFALTILPPGRASVLAFSTPIWVVPLAALWLHERAAPAALLGMGLGLMGVLAIAAPSVHLDGGAQVIAYAMLLGAAVLWAISIVVVRAHRFTSGALALAPWQTLVAACLLLPVALAAEGAPRSVGVSGAASLAFVGPVATAFAYWAVVETGRHFSARTLSMALLATPPVGILLSAANPKNLALTAAAAASIAQTGLDSTDTALAALVFVVIGSLTVAGSVVFYLVDTDKASVALGSVKEFMSAHNAVIMMVILLILGVKILGDGLGGLSV
jgi:hypothetical protein